MNKRFIILLFCCFIAAGKVYAGKTIRGYVRDADTGEILPVAHIRVAGTFSGTISNEKGEYILELEELPAAIIISYIGYKSEKLTITENSPDEQNVSLSPSPVILKTVVVSGEDKAVRIMREVIRRKQEWRKTLETFKADAYTRVVLENDTTIVIINESISDIFWDIKKGTREVIKSKRQTKNIKVNQNFASARMTPNLYDDDVNMLGFDVIGPTHPDALKHYNFKIIERQMLDDKTVYVISINPKSKLQPALVGTISILDEEFAMIDLDLKPSRAIMFPVPLNNFSFAVKQKFSNFDREYWLPVDVHVKGEIKIKLPGIEFPTIKYSQLTRLADYEVNAALPDSLYNKDKKKKIQVTVSNESVSVKSTDETVTEDLGKNKTIAAAEDSTAIETVAECAAADEEALKKDAVTIEKTVSDSTTDNDTAAAPDAETIAADSIRVESPQADPDSLFALNSNMVPLTEREKEAYGTIDSTLTGDKAFKPKGFLVRLLDDDKKKKIQKEQSGISKTLSKAFSGFTPRVRHNRVDAYHLGLKYKRSIKSLTFVLTGAYKTGLKRWFYGGEVTYYPGKEKKGSIVLSSKTATEPRYHSDIYPVWLNSVQTLSGSDDYFDYFRNDKTSAAFGYRFKKLKTKISAGINFEHHISLSKSTDYTLLGRVKKQRENPSIQKGQLRSLELTVSCGDSRSSFGLAGMKGAEFKIEHSSPDIFKSDFSFTRYLITLNWRIKTFLKRRLLSNTLDLRFTGGTSGGKLPIQRFLALDGCMMRLAPFGVFRSLKNHPLEGEHYGALFWEHNFRTVPFELLGLRWVAKKGIGVILHGAAGRTWISDNRLKQLNYMPFYNDGFINEIGLSLNGLFGLLRIDATKRLDKRGYEIGFGIARIM